MIPPCAIHVYVILGVTFGLQHLPFRYLYGPLPTSFCYYSNILVFGYVLAVILIFTEIHLFRLLFASVWKNVAALHDDIVLAFLKTLNLLLVAVYVAGIHVADAMPTRTHYLLCVGRSQAAFRAANPRLAARATTAPSSIFFGLLQVGSLAFWVFVNLRIHCERKTLERIQKRTRDSTGLPRLYSSHPGLSHMKRPILFYSFMFLTFASQGALEHWAREDRLQTPGLARLQPFISTLPPLFGSVVFPLLTICKTKKYCDSFKRRLKEMLPFYSHNIVELLFAKVQG